MFPKTSGSFVFILCLVGIFVSAILATHAAFILLYLHARKSNARRARWGVWLTRLAGGLGIGILLACGLKGCYDATRASHASIQRPAEAGMGR